MRELVARVGAAARRGVRPAEEKRGEPIEIEELRVDPREVQAFIDGRSAGPDTDWSSSCSTHSRSIRGRVVTRDELLQKVGAAARRTATAPSTSSSRRLRQKVDLRLPRNSFIQTRFGVGYKLEAEPK